MRLEKKPISFLYLKKIFGVNAMSQRRAVVSVVGKDQVGIIAKVTTVLANENVNIFDISQTILQDFFTMMMIVDVTNLENLEALQQKLTDLGDPLGLTINVQLEEIFHAMHRV
jgi:ACT domain-containing protein